MICPECGGAFIARSANKKYCGTKCVKARYEREKYLRITGDKVKIVVVTKEGEIIKFDDTSLFKKANLDTKEAIVLYGVPHTQRASKQLLERNLSWASQKAREALKKFIMDRPFSHRGPGKPPKPDPLSSDNSVEAIELIKEGVMYAKNMENLSKKSGVSYSAMLRWNKGSEEPTELHLNKLRVCVEELRG
jgi:hypothetical protein